MMKPSDSIQLLKMDKFLNAQGLWRKPTAKDGISLYRATAEQVLLCQAQYTVVQEECNAALEKLTDNQHNSKDCPGQTEIWALSLIYRHDYLIYEEVGKPPVNVSQNGYQRKVYLCCVCPEHYESVYRLTRISNFALCQSILYDLLYSEIFHMDKDQIKVGVEMVRNKGLRKSSIYMEEENNNFKFQSIEERCDAHPPFPYRVAKALDPDIYRNVEYDSFLEMRKDVQQKKNQTSFSQGDRCQVTLNDQLYKAHIQELHSGSDMATVYIEGLGQKHSLPCTNIIPMKQERFRKTFNIARGLRTLQISPGHHAHLRTPPRFTQGLFNSCGLPSKKYWTSPEGLHFRQQQFMKSGMLEDPFFGFRNNETQSSNEEESDVDITLDRPSQHTNVSCSIPTLQSELQGDPQMNHCNGPSAAPQSIWLVPWNIYQPVNCPLVFVPYADNLPGPVNFAVEPSKETAGRDLPGSSYGGGNDQMTACNNPRQPIPYQTVQNGPASPLPNLFPWPAVPFYPVYQ